MEPSAGYRTVTSANEVVTRGISGVVGSAGGWLSGFFSSTAPPTPEFRGPPPTFESATPATLPDTRRTAPLLGGGLGLSAMDTVRAPGAPTRFYWRMLYMLLGLSLLALFFVPLGLYLTLQADADNPSSSPQAPPTSGTNSPPPPPSGTIAPILPSPPPAPPPPPSPPPPLPQHTNETLACASATGAWLNATVWRNYSLPFYPTVPSFFDCRAKGPFFQGNGQVGHQGTVLPLPTDLIFSSMAAACVTPEAAARTRAAYVATPSDVCYFYAYPVGQSSPPAALSTWVTQIDPSRLWTFPIPATPRPAGGVWEGDPALNGLAAAAASAPQGGVCKWWLLASPTAWVNPRVVLQAVQGMPWDVAPLVLGNFWDQMGFFFFSTAPSPTVLFSQAAVRALGGLSSGAGRCLRAGPPPACTPSANCQISYLWFCLLTEGGVIPVHLQNTDNSGALSNNGVPLEPGPYYPNFYSYLLQPHQLATHFAWMEGVDSSNALWPAFKGVYGPWGLLREGGGDSSRRGTLGTTLRSSATPAAAGSECLSYATSLLREYLDAGRTSPTSATPLSLDLVGEVIVGACGALPLPLPSARSLLFALAQVDPGDACAGVNTLLQVGWGGVYAQQILVFGPPPPAPAAAGCQSVIGDASFQGVSASAAGAQLLTAVSRELEVRGGSISAYPWVFLGGDRSLVNPQAMAGLTVGLPPDIPLALSFYVASPLGGPTPPTSVRPMGGLLLLSRAAVALVMPLLGTPVCPLSGNPLEFTPDGGALGRCLWVAGVLPVHTFSIDPLGFALPLIDWTFGQIHVQNSFAVSMISDRWYNDYVPRAFSFRRASQQATYCGCGNITSACNGTTKR